MTETEMLKRETDRTAITIDRKIPLWGILTIGFALLAGSYAQYASYLAMSTSVDKLTVAVEKQRDTQTAAAIKDTQHDFTTQQNGAAIAELRREVEELKRRRWENAK